MVGEFRFSWPVPVRVNGQLTPLTSGVQPVVEDFQQWNGADKPSFGLTQVGKNICLKLRV